MFRVFLAFAAVLCLTESAPLERTKRQWFPSLYWFPYSDYFFGWWAWPSLNELLCTFTYCSMIPPTQYHFVMCGRISSGSYGRDCGAGYGATRGAEKSSYATGESPAGNTRSAGRGRQEPAYPSGSDVPQEGAVGSAAKVNPPASDGGASQASMSSASEHPEGAPSEGSKEPEPTHSETSEGAPHSPAESALGPSEGQEHPGNPSTSEEPAHPLEHGGESEIKGQENGIEAGVEQPAGDAEEKKETGQAADADVLEQRQAIEVPASSIDQ